MVQTTVTPDLTSSREAVPGAPWKEEVRAELRAWLTLAVASLGVAGAFALMLAASRIHGMQNLLPWPVDFFSKGLVIHVVFSLVLWLLTVFALLVSIATDELMGGMQPRWNVLGRVGCRLTAYAFPLLFVPAFLDGSEASLNNYVPVIIHPFYYLGLLLFAVAIALPVVRLLANLRPNWTQSGPLTFAMIGGSVLYLMALFCVFLASLQLTDMPLSRSFNEQLFWGGGHVMQFLNCLLLLTGWFLLLRQSLGDQVTNLRLFKLAVVIIVVFSSCTPIFYFSFDPYSVSQVEAFRRLKFVLGVPAILVAASGFAAVMAVRSNNGLPWRDPAFVAVVLSVIVFGAGGVMGLVISGSDTRTPAHYHAVIAAVNLAMMGLAARYCLPRMGCPMVPRKALTRQLVLFGLGQLAASIGLFLAGGYGAPRKAPAAESIVVDGAVVGLYLNGIGAVFAVVGGVLFVVGVVRSLRRYEVSPTESLKP